jgi:uncharacterized metal-binding protein
MTERQECSCGKICYNLVFPCSGAADVGAIADQAARTLSHKKAAFMCCTTGIAAEIPELLEKAAFASKIVVIDGCDKDCARKILDKAGFTDHAHIELGALSMEKAKTPVTSENIEKVANVAAMALTGETRK